jgi:hypothetical protein
MKVVIIMTVLRLGQISDRNLPIILIMDWFIDRLRDTPHLFLSPNYTLSFVHVTSSCSIK